MVAAPEFVHSVAVANELGEGVLWNDTKQSAWWTDIERSRLFEYDPESDALATWATPHRVACFGFVAGDERLIVAFDRGIAFYDPPSGDTEWLVGPGALADGLRFNDGKVDPLGRFWVGTMIEDRRVARDSGALYCLDPGLGLIEHIGGLTISNGLCWSPDGLVMYHADSPRNTIFAYRFARDSGVPFAKWTFATTPAHAYPDGSTTDAEGGVWNAQWGAGQVVRYGADGQPDIVLDVPVSQPSCVAFGGSRRDLLFVTSARQGLDAGQLEAEPEAGNLLIYQTEFTGLPGYLWRLPDMREATR